jgi:hypothetical protein
MTPKQRLTEAFHFREADDIVPFWELEFHLYREMFGREPVLGTAFDRLSRAEKERAIDSGADLVAETAVRFDYSAVTAPGSYWEQGPGEPAYYWIRDPEWRRRFVRALSERLAGRCAVAAYSDSCACIPTGADLAGFVYRMADRPEEVDAANESILRQGVDEGLRMIEAGAEILVNACDIAFNSGTFFTPPQLERFVYPYFRRWNGAFEGRGAWRVLHTDGDVGGILPEIMDCGFDGLQCVDPLAGMDLAACKKRTAGRMTLVGNMSVAALHTGTAAGIEAEARRILEGAKAGGGFVFGCCNAVFRGIPPDHYELLLDCRERYGRIGHATV